MWIKKEESLLIRPTRYWFHIRQQIPKLTVIYFYAVIEIQGDALVCTMAEFFVEGTEFGLLFVEYGYFFFQFF